MKKKFFFRLIGFLVAARGILHLVRATSVVCLLGLGLGLGSLLLYKLCRRIFARRRPVVDDDDDGDDEENDQVTGRASGGQVAQVQAHGTSPLPTRLWSEKNHSRAIEHPSPDSQSDSGVSTMGNYQSDVSAGVSPESAAAAVGGATFPSVFYNTVGGVRFRGFRKDDRLLEEESDPLVQRRRRPQRRSRAVANLARDSSDDGVPGDFENDKEEDEDDDEEDDGEDDEMQELLSGRRAVRRSPSSIRRQLTIEIPLDERSTIHYQRGLSPASDDDEDANHISRDISFDGQSVGGFSLMPNFSPTSLHEKNLRLVSADVPSTSLQNDVSVDAPSAHDDVTAEAQSADVMSVSSKTGASVSELTTCTMHPLQQTRDSPDSTNESEVSKPFEGSSSSRTQSEYLSSEPRSRSLSPEVMNILSKYRNSFDSSGSASPDFLKHHQRNFLDRTTKPLCSSEPSRNDIDDWLEKRRQYLKHSCSSISSGASSVDLSSREVTLRARSLDFSDNPSGLGTPDSELFAPTDVGLRTAASMEQIQNELRNIEAEIADMSCTFKVLSSRENLHAAAAAAADVSQPPDPALVNSLRVLERHRSRDDIFATMTRSLSACDEADEAESVSSDGAGGGAVGSGAERRTWRYSYQHVGQYVWDYQSDLAATRTPPTRRRFVDHWGTVDDDSTGGGSGGGSRSHSGTQSPSFEHIRSYLRQSADSSPAAGRSPSHGSGGGGGGSGSAPSSASAGGSCGLAHTPSIADLYIDDELSGLVSCDTKQPPPLVDPTSSGVGGGGGGGGSGGGGGGSGAGGGSSSCDSSTTDSASDVEGGHDPHTCSGPYGITRHEYSSLGPELSSDDNQLLVRNIDDTDLNVDGEQRSDQQKDSHHTLAMLQQGECHDERDGSSEADGLPSGETRLSIGPRRDLMAYAQQEWKGDTPKAKTILQGYKAMHDDHGFTHLRQVRGDNYCALRATLFQMFRAGVSLPEPFNNRDYLLQELKLLLEGDSSKLKDLWTFAGRLQRGSATVYDTACRCLDRLLHKMEEIATFTTKEQRESIAESFLNDTERSETGSCDSGNVGSSSIDSGVVGVATSSTGLKTDTGSSSGAETTSSTASSAGSMSGSGERDVELMEAVKLLLLLGAARLETELLAGRDVPIFVMLLFARDTSPDLRQLAVNHLDTIGGEGGLEQVEMLLLGHVVGARLFVFRPSQQGKADFLTCFGEEGDQTPALYMVAEDDRHYNVPL